MSIVSIVILAIVVIALIWAVMIYNNLVNLKHAVAKAWANIDVLLKQRHDELPKLVETCKQYKQFEQDTLQRVTDARGRVQEARMQQNMPALGQAETALRAGLGSIYATVEAYPELKAMESFQHLISRISGLENAIADRREFYNESVNVNNVAIEQFPEVFIANVSASGRSTCCASARTRKRMSTSRSFFPEGKKGLRALVQLCWIPGDTGLRP